MITFLSVCLYAFAGCAALGLIPAAVMSALAGQPRLVAYVLAVAGFVMFVLISAAGRLQ